MSPAAVKTLDEIGGVAQEHGVAGGPRYHGEHGKPHISEGLGRKPSIPYAEHVGHCLAERGKRELMEWYYTYLMFAKRPRREELLLLMSFS